MKIIFITILIILRQVSFGQESKIDSFFKIFQKDVELEQTYHAGKVLWDDDTKESYYLLMKISPIDSLIKYTDNSNPAIRCMIFGGLLNKNADKKILSKIVNNHRDDTAICKIQPTDAYVECTVAEYLKSSFKYLKTKDSASDFGESLNRLKQYPKIILPGLRHGRIGKEKLASTDSLAFNHKKVKILSFNLVFTGGPEFDELKSENHFLTSTMKKRITQLKSGDLIVIDDIKVFTEDGFIRNMVSVVIRIE